MLRSVFRILHLVMLSIATLTFGAATVAWFSEHRAAGMPTVADFANLGGLLLGTGLGGVLLRPALRSTPLLRRKTSIVLYGGWILVFAWYWFNRFTVDELHALDANRMSQELIQQRGMSIIGFVFWVGLFLIGPVLAMRRLRN